MRLYTIAILGDKKNIEELSDAKVSDNTYIVNVPLTNGDTVWLKVIDGYDPSNRIDAILYTNDDYDRYHSLVEDECTDLIYRSDDDDLSSILEEMTETMYKESLYKEHTSTRRDTITQIRSKLMDIEYLLSSLN